MFTIDEIRKILNDDKFLQLKLNYKNDIRFKYNKIILNFIKQKYNLNIDIKEILFLYINKNNLENLHIFCPVCGKKNKLSTNYCTKGYNKHCSRSCSSLDKNTIATRQQTNIIRHNNPNYVNREQTDRTNMQKIGYKTHLQIKEVYSKGIKAAAAKDVRKRAINTTYKRFGKKFINESKTIQTNRQKYGTDWQISSKSTRQKSKETFRKKYNKDNFMQTEQFKNISKNMPTSHSKAELRCYELLKTKFIDAINTYKDERYPFNCDFYIPSKDLFIELNLFWMHGKEPFDKNNKEHLKRLNDIYKKIDTLKKIKRQKCL